MARVAAQLSRCLSVFALLCGLSVSNTCDGAGRATQVQAPPLSDGTQVVTQTVYDRAGNAVGTINPLGNRTDVTYNARNRNVRTTGTPAPDGVTGGMTRPLTDWSYDGVGNVLTVTDPRNYVTGRIRGQLLTLDVSVRCQELTPSFGSRQRN